ncbi:MAG: hypothetical protein B1H08_00840 [Candidatus Omnitrophica bacterium 4484_171]|nr:MAG: hypothetical protein B1H08_00840 [Candidatus Omnitrophica bacterium 4484_171]
MGLKLFLSTFLVVFLAELFDKTEIAIVSLSLKGNSKIFIFLGAMAAFLVATVLALVLGDLLARYINPKFIRYICAATFFIVGFLSLFGKI